MKNAGRDMSFKPPIKPLTALRDEQLLSAAQAGSSEAFAELQSLYSRRLFSKIVAITKNREDAEDALQDTFLRAYAALHKFEGRSGLYCWLMRIAINSALMILRKRRSRPEATVDLFYDGGDDFPQLEVKDSALDPEQIYDQRQRCVSMLRAIHKLNPNLRGPIQIRLAHGCSLEEIARTLDISVVAVKTRLHRARARLSAARVFRNVEE
jgi:RNA polymerase sigma-70 factor, ECF subfamily